MTRAPTVLASLLVVLASTLAACGGGSGSGSNGGGGGVGGGGGGGGAPTPSLLLSTASISLHGMTGDTQLRTVAIDLTFTGLAVGPYLEATASGGGIMSVVASQSSATTGILYVNFSAPNVVGDGTFPGNVSLKACVDASCTQVLAGSPYSVATSYVIDNSQGAAGPGGYTLRTYNVGAVALAVDPATGSLYILQAGDGMANGYVAGLDPATGALGHRTALAAAPTGGIDISQDGHYLYASQADGTITRRVLPGLAEDLSIPVGTWTDTYSGSGYVNPQYPLALAVSRSTPTTVAAVLALTASETTAGWRQVNVFDNAVRRSNPAFDNGPGSFGADVQHITWSADDSAIYGVASHLSLQGLVELQVAPAGIASARPLIGWIEPGRAHLVDGLIYLDDGNIYSLFAQNYLDPLKPFTYWTSNVVPDSVNGRLFMTSIPGEASLLRAAALGDHHTLYDITLPLPAAAPVVFSSLVRWGSNGLAWLTIDGHAVVLTGAFVKP